MQSSDLSANFTESTDRTNFRASSSCRTLDEGTEMHRQVAELSQTVADLKSAIHTKDLQIENLHRDNERLASELKKQQRCNRNLKQQLDDERFFYQKEKEHFCEEMQTHRAKCIGSTTKAQQQQRRESERIRESLEDENKQLRDEILEKSEVTYNLCIKFLRMKDARDSLGRKLDRLLQEHLQVMAEMMEKLDEAREELNIIVSDKFQDPLPMCKAKFLQVVQRNSKLVYENSTLKLHIQQLTQNIERLKSNVQKTKTINVDARTIEKLTECSRRRRNEEATRISTSLYLLLTQLSLRPAINKMGHRNGHRMGHRITIKSENSKYSCWSCSTNLGKSLSVSKSTTPLNTPNIERLSDTKMISAIRTKQRGKLTVVDSPKFRENTSSELPTERTQSAPEIVQSSTFRQAQFSETPTNCTEVTEGSADFRDVGTNT